MKILTLSLALLVSAFALSPSAYANETAAAPERSVQERLDDLEAYMNNVARNATTTRPRRYWPRSGS
jgi:hypothetical protein